MAIKYKYKFGLIWNLMLSQPISPIFNWKNQITKYSKYFEGNYLMNQ